MDGVVFFGGGEMKKGIICLVFVLFLSLFTQSGFASLVTSIEISGRPDQAPVGILSMEDDIYVLFQEPAQLVRYNLEWTETAVLELPEDFIPTELMEANGWIWILSERTGQVLKVAPKTMGIAEIFGDEYPHSFVALFEANGNALLLDEEGYIHLVGEDFETLGWMTGLKLYQSAFYDGFHVYLGGRVRPAESGVLVKDEDDEEIDEWLMTDDSRAPVEKDVVERIRLLSDGYFYIMYRDTGIVKYDEFGNYRNRIYNRSTQSRTFYDITYIKALDKYYMVDRDSGIFEARWSWDRRIVIKKNQPDTSGHRLTTRTVLGMTTAQIGQGRLMGFYREEEDNIQIIVPTRDVDTLKLRIPTSDLLIAEEQDLNQLQIHWKEQVYEFAIDSWRLGLYDRENIEEQFVEIRIENEKVVVDHCIVERLDEKTKSVRRENLE